MAPDGFHLAELNVGRRLAPTDDPRVAEFMENLDRVNGLGKRMSISGGTMAVRLWWRNRGGMLQTLKSNRAGLPGAYS